MNNGGMKDNSISASFYKKKKIGVIVAKAEDKVVKT